MGETRHRLGWKTLYREVRDISRCVQHASGGKDTGKVPGCIVTANRWIAASADQPVCDVGRGRFQYPSETFENINMDFLINSVEGIGGYRQSMILVDAKGSFVANVNTTDKSSKTLITALRSVFHSLGTQKYLIIDRDSPLCPRLYLSSVRRMAFTFILSRRIATSSTVLPKERLGLHEIWFVQPALVLY